MKQTNKSMWEYITYNRIKKEVLMKYKKQLIEKIENMKLNKEICNYALVQQIIKLIKEAR